MAHLFADSILALLLLRVALGMPWGAAQTATMTVAVDLIPEKRRGEGLSFFGLTFTLAGTIAPLLSLAIMERFGFDAVFESAAAIVVVSLLLAFATRQRELPKSTSSFALRSVFEIRVLWIAVATLLTTSLWGAVISFLPLYSTSQGLPSAGVFFSLDAVGTLCSRVFTGKLLDRYGPTPVLAASYLTLSAALILLGMATGPLVYGASALLLGAGFGVMIPTVQTMCMNLVEPQRRGAANATLYSAFDIGIGGGAIVLGAIAEAAGYRAMFVLQGVALVLPAALFFFFIVPSYKRMIAATATDALAIH
jgi:predicted MFS family arabinose efflux permease